MQSRYSLVFYPSEVVMDEVWRMKQELSAAIGWYNSKNAKAHITVFNFAADHQREIPKITAQLQALAVTEPSFDVCLDHTHIFESGAFCLMPAAAGEQILIQLMARLQSAFQLDATHRSDKPHVSIGRRLNPQQLIIAKNMFTAVNLPFKCNRLVLRIFDPAIKQYQLFKEFTLAGGDI